MKKLYSLLCIICGASLGIHAQQISAVREGVATVKISYTKAGQVFTQQAQFSDQAKFMLPVWTAPARTANYKAVPSDTAGYRNGEADSLFYFFKQVIGWKATAPVSLIYRDSLHVVFYFDQRDALFYNFEYKPGFWAGAYPVPQTDKSILTMEPLSSIPNYRPDSAGWHVNDHCFIHYKNQWHVYAIVSPNPGVPAYGPFNFLGHAVSRQLTSKKWKTASPSFYDSTTPGSVLWAPHVVQSKGLYYLFYCAGGKPEQFAIALRTSTDLTHWSDQQILFRGGYQARDPMVLWVAAAHRWVMYYCATTTDSGGHHVVASRTSDDLIHWGRQSIVYTDIHAGTDYGNTESPFVVKHGNYYYLFTGPRPYDYPTAALPNHLHPGYVGTDVYRSKQYDHFENAGFVAHLPVHAAEIIQDDNHWFISSAGEIQGGLYITPLHWNFND